MLFVNVIYALRLLTESIFCYFVYNYKDKNDTSQKYNIKKMAVFCLVHVTLLSLYMHLFTDFVVYRLVSIPAIFAYFWIENWVENKKVKKRNIKGWSYILTFSIFISLITECSHFIGYITNRCSWKLSGMYDSTKTTNLELYHLTALTLHICFMFLVYKFHFAKMKDIKNLSAHKQIPILFGMCLLTVIYIKYNYQLIDNEILHDILIGTLLFILPTYMGFYWNSCKLTRLRNIDQNYALDSVIENMLRMPIFCAIININPLAYIYEKDRITFKKKLEKLGINHSCKGYSQLVLSLIIISHFEGDDLDFEKNVFHHVSRFTRTKPETVYDNINNIIQKTWFQESPEDLKYGYSYVDNVEDNPPTVNDFLINIAKNPV